jgi:LacI family transcriptional regulator
MAAHRKADGVIVHAPRVQDPRVALLRELGLTFLVHGRDGSAEPDYPFLDINNRRAFRRATDFLLDLGHRRIALVNGLESLSFAWRRRLGYEEALAARGLWPDPRLMRSAEMVEPYGNRSAREMLALPAPPTAFLTASVIVAFGVMRAVRDAGLRLGRDISILTHDDALTSFAAGPTVPVFTATRASILDAGRRAAQLLIAHMADPAAPAPQELWDADLTVGQSTGPVQRESQHA